MSGNAQLAQTGAPALVIGGVAYPIGGWMAVAAVLLLAVGLICIRLRFRPNLASGQAQAEAASSGGRKSRRHRR